MPTGFSIGPLYVHFYGVIIMLGALAAAFVADWNARRQGMKNDLVWDMLPWLLIAGIIGARLWHIFTPPPSMVAVGKDTMWYLTNPVEMLKVWNGGVGIPGAVIGGALALWLYTRKYKLNFLRWIDIVAPGLALAQAIGRWGNFINQEIYGAPTNLPWAIYIDEIHRLPELRNVAYYHPLFLYESLWNLANMAFLLWFGRRFASRLRPGDVFLVYMIFYPVGRFLLEFLRLDAAQVGGINFNQTFMAVIAVIAALLLFIRHRTGAVSDSREVTDTAEETAD